MQQGYTGPEVCKITGISYRQLDHWTTTSLVDASIRNIKGSGYRSRRRSASRGAGRSALQLRRSFALLPMRLTEFSGDEPAMSLTISQGETT